MTGKSETLHMTTPSSSAQLLAGPIDPSLRYLPGSEPCEHVVGQGHEGRKRSGQTGGRGSLHRSSEIVSLRKDQNGRQGQY